MKIGLKVVIVASLIWLPASHVLCARWNDGPHGGIVRNSLAPVVTTVMNYRVDSNEAPEGFPGTQTGARLAEMVRTTGKDSK